ncbi:MAG: response regulator [Gemmatimonadota bacterium]
MISLAARTEPLTVLLVDDDVLAVHLLDELIGMFSSARREAFTDPLDAVAWMERQVPDLVITDFDMPGLNGLALLRRLRSDPRTAEIPVLMITGIEDPDLRLAALDAGAHDFIRKPFDGHEVRSRVRNMLALREGQRAQQRRNEQLSLEVARAVGVIRERERETILRLARAAEYRDSDTHAHLVRIADYADLVAEGMDIGRVQREALSLAAPMHDIGKIGIPDEIVHKPGRLDPSEYEVMKTHTSIGHAILDGSSSDLLQLAAEIALSHHERWDGQGYPHGLRGEEIPISGRIVAVADVFDALTSSRPYKEAWDRERALTYLADGAGSQFDPACVTAFLERRDRIFVVRARVGPPAFAEP